MVMEEVHCFCGGGALFLSKCYAKCLNAMQNMLNFCGGGALVMEAKGVAAFLSSKT